MSKKNDTLKATREQSGKTQAEIAKEIGILKEVYQKYEYGMSSKTISTAIKIAKALNSSVEELWGNPEKDLSTI